MKRLFISLLCCAVCATAVQAEVTYSLSGTTLTISYSGSGSTEMQDFDDSYVGTGEKRPDTWSSITKLVVEEGVTRIGTYAFDGCSYLATATFPSTLKSIGNRAFRDCKAVKAIHAYSPNHWASVEFDATSQGEADYTHPFGKSSASARNFYFYGSTSATTNLVFFAGLTEIKSYAFYRANKIEEVSIPGTVAHIGDHALDCQITKNLAINRKTPPTTGTKAITFKTGNTFLYVPEGAGEGYKSSPWKGGTNGANYIGYYYNNSYQDNSSIAVSGLNGKLCRTSGTKIGTANISWNLSEDGVLTLEGSGNLPGVTTSYSKSTVIPWYRFRRLVNKVIVKGGITDLNKALTWCYALQEVVIEQNNVPIASSISYSDLFNQRDNVILSVKPATLTHSSATNLSSTPWDNTKLTIALSEPLVLNENEDQTTLMDRVFDYIDEPFTLELGRTLSNAYANTFCSPINMDADLIAATFGAGTQVYTLTASTFSEAENDLTLAFDVQTTITAGKPYIIHPTTTVTNPSIADVQPSTLSSSADNVTSDYVTFYGTLTPREVTEGEKANSSFIFLQANNKLAWANEGTLKGMRAYFILNDNVADNIKKARPIMRLGNSATAITIVGAEPQAGEVQKIIRDGQMLIIRDGKTYNAMGMIVE